MNLTEVLNKEQYDAVTYINGPLLVLAGAGTGKTRVITYRIYNLIENEQIEPERIMAVTFTNKAASEMKQRLYYLVGEKVNNLWIGTFHSIALRLLRLEYDKAGLNQNFGVIDQEDRISLIRDILKKLNIDSKKYPPKVYLNIISSYKNTLSFVEKLPLNEDFYMVSEVFDEYQKNLSFLNMVDFDDMISLVVRIFLGNKNIAEYYQNLFQHILVDEYQDTNTLQFVFLQQLSGVNGNICAVGDDDQSIYGWRGADINNILDFDKYFENTKIVKLINNYRSQQNVLIAANKLISNNRFRKGKELLPALNLSGEILIKSCYDEQDEAAWVAKKIKYLVDNGTSYNEIAVLYRTNAQSRNFEVEFNKLKIPYKVIGSIGFYQRREIKDILSYLRVYENPYDFQSFIRTMKNPSRGFGNVTIDKLIRYSFEHNVDIFKSIEDNLKSFTTKQTENIKEYLRIFEGLKGVRLVSEMIDYIIKAINYEEYMKQFEEVATFEKRILNLEELINSAAAMEEKGELTLNEFLSNITLISSTDEDAGENVNVMTVHAAKGLEFDTVFLTGLEEGLFPLYGSMDDERALEEERRLCYVGVTRAKRNLYVSYASSRLHYGKRVSSYASSFINEIKIPKTFEEKSDGSEIKEGAKVRHEKFGEGIVISITGSGEDAKVDVFFKLCGLKKIVKRFLSA
ncbi:UvrD-helicase domain-containing protein [Deferribacterales bacterium Es71-Z0220]|jgi:DNA helicase-2/ATP-dependent DNA helicase PcrA|uniref:ATP-dependent helicase n=1 Tax=Deferrivibrio essentukiensis TaxID=2880922 RepID=UPI001F6132A7|nr:UvrD-helicase domain-containing protein [Deferrivibrio essentukiensis]MBZ4672937.1 ATP-dependent helicase PcrA [Deferribacteraceae bacterium]MCB4203893.1 UvrD-helicase domain-containing protein [Deferrivibrio essentukiensis]